ncbi:MAG TPA: nucleoside hydrolase-like domain-containing protein [Micromonosporaceae bacterium]|nr:nucleoside hydrolase-like domain-containing protein [Micromonosporaceae bacterium]
MARPTRRWIGAAAALGIAGAASAVALTLAGPASAAVDIAIGKPATASAQQGPRPATNGNDGSATTRWSANTPATGHWWQVDLGAATAISGTEVTWEFARNYRYQISVSANGSAFTTVVDKNGNTSAAQTQADTFTASARYVRITITGLPTDVETWASFYTFSVFGAGGGTTPTTPPGPVDPGTPVAAAKQRVAVLTDISNEPDDEESLVRFLVYSNEYDVETLIATTSRHLRTGPRADLINRQIGAYEQVRPNLIKHAAGYPTAAHLRSVTATGQTTLGMAAVGAGRSTAGSRLLIAAADKADSRPLWVSIWGGSNTLAQALFDVRATRTAAQLAAFVAKLRVYTISDQDDAGPWLRQNFPGLSYIVSPGTNYGGATWSGISGDVFYANGPRYMFDMVQNPWITTNIIRNHGPLGALYPPVKYIMEGDTPSFLGLVNNGLGWATSPSYGGWGGRYVRSGGIWTDSSDTFDGTTSDQATIWRWRDHYQNDFAARMDWNVATTFERANHNPVPALNGDRSKDVVTINARSGTAVNLSAAGTTDPDGNPVTLRWFIYGEAGTFSGGSLSTASGQSTTVNLPTGRTGTLHVILQATDNGSPPLTSYRRVVLNVTA